MGSQKESFEATVTDEQDVAFEQSEDATDTDVLDEGTFVAETVSSDNVGMSSVQFDVEELIADLESEAPEGVDKNGRLRKRLDALRERKRRHQALIDFDDYDI
jgi:hypothetical protein